MCLKSYHTRIFIFIWKKFKLSSFYDINLFALSSVQTGCCSRLTAFSVRPVAGVNAALAYRLRRRSRQILYLPVVSTYCCCYYYYHHHHHRCWWSWCQRRDWRFSQQCWWTFKSSGMLRRAGWWRVTDVSKKRRVSICRVKHSKNGLL
jgi:hypothetical protein